jgi:hypothetical protein
VTKNDVFEDAEQDNGVVIAYFLPVGFVSYHALQIQAILFLVRIKLRITYLLH